jgi:iron complex outermembrane recepter protein
MQELSYRSALAAAVISRNARANRASTARLALSFLLAVVTLLALMVSPAVAQQGGVTGSVVDTQTGEPLRGARVGTPDGSAATVTDGRGRFELTVPPAATELLVDFLGYKAMPVPLGANRQNIRVRMEISPVQLNEVVVAGYGANRRLLETPGAIAVIPKEVLERGNPVFMQQALESVPGVRLEMSNPNQQRLSIRGVGVRAHNSGGIRAFINDIPITEAEGSTNLSQIDVTTLGQIEVLKGPSSSLFGAGLGGVVNLRTERPTFLGRVFEASTVGGSDGLQRVGGNLLAGGTNGSLMLSYGRFNYDGFREHDRHSRNELNAVGEFYTSDQNTVSVLVTRTESDAQLAGAVTLADLQADPRRANATSVRQNVNQNNVWTRLGITNSYAFSDRFSNTTVVHNTFGGLDHPVSSAVLRNSTHTYGARTRFTYRAAESVGPRPRISVGGEYMQGLTLRRRYANLGGGEAGSLIGDSEQTTPYYNVFAQGEADLSARTLLTLGLSYNHASLRVLDLRNPHLSGSRTFDPTISPRVALNHRITDHISGHVSVSHGYLPPAASRTIDADGSVNMELDPETAINYEVGVRGLVFGDRLNFDASVFSLRMRDELISRSIDQGITVWVNAGRTTHNGFETALSYALIQDPSGVVTSLRPYLAYSYSDFTFGEFLVGGTDHAGNVITGTAPHAAQLGFDVTTRPGIYGSIRHSYTDRMPLDDRNTDFAEAYHLLGGKIGYATTLGRTGVDAHLGVDNLTDTLYASRLNFNASGGMYYQPAPGRTVYAGVTLRPRF